MVSIKKERQGEEWAARKNSATSHQHQKRTTAKIGEPTIHSIPRKGKKLTFVECHHIPMHAMPFRQALEHLGGLLQTRGQTTPQLPSKGQAMDHILGVGTQTLKGGVAGLVEVVLKRVWPWRGWWGGRVDCCCCCWSWSGRGGGKEAARPLHDGDFGSAV